MSLYYCYPLIASGHPQAARALGSKDSGRIRASPAAAAAAAICAVQTAWHRKHRKHRKHLKRVSVKALSEDSVDSVDSVDYSAEDLRLNFSKMSILFALNHGVVTTPLAVSTSLLNLDVATFGNGLLYIVTICSSLLLGAPAVGRFGPKGGLIFGMIFYCFYIAFFASSLLFSDLQSLLFTAGSACGGLAAGVLWTAQGTYFSSSASKLSQATQEDLATATADLSGEFAFAYLFLEVLSKLLFSFLQTLGVQISIIAGLYFLTASVSVLLILQIYDLPSESKSEPVFKKALAAISLWSDPTLWLLAPTNFCFGFCAAYMNGFVNARFAAQELGEQSVAFLGAVTALTAAFLAKTYGALSNQQGKGFVIFLGALSAVAIPLLTFNGCVGWGWSLLSLYFLQGSVRAVYESTNRAVFSDFFPGRSEGAFANCLLQSSLGFATCFFLQNSLTDQLSTIIILLALSTTVGYNLATIRETPKDA